LPGCAARFRDAVPALDPDRGQGFLCPNGNFASFASPRSLIARISRLTELPLVLRRMTTVTLLSIGFRLERFTHVVYLILRNRQWHIQAAWKHERHEDHRRMIRRTPNVAPIDFHDVSIRKVPWGGPTLLAS